MEILNDKNDVVGTVVREGNTFYLANGGVKDQPVLSTKEIGHPLSLWHKCLGHPSLKYLMLLHKQGNIKVS